MSSEVVGLLASLRSGDNTARDAAEKAYANALKTDPGQILFALVGCLDPSACPDEVTRTQAATLVRRATVQVGASDTAWIRCGPAIQSQIKANLFRALEMEPSQSVKKMLVACIAAIASQGDDVVWPELVPNTIAMAGTGNPQHQDTALRILSDLIGTSFAKEVLSKRQEIGALTNIGLATPALQPAAIGLMCQMVSTLDMETCQGMQPILPMVENAIKSLAASNPTAFDDALSSMIESATEKPLFFKPRFAEWVEMMLVFANAKGTIEDSYRSLAFEWVSTIAESKSKALIKAVPDLPQKVLHTAFVFMGDLEEDAQWQTIDADEEEDDDDSLAKMGEGKVDLFVRKLGFEQTGKPLLALLEQHSASPQWQGRVASAMSIRAAGEYVKDNSCLDAMAGLLLKLVQDSHYRVRYAGVFALGQMCHDQDADFLGRWHARFVPQLLATCNDPVDRVAAMAASGLEAVISDLDEEVLQEYAKPILECFVQRLNTCSHKGVLVSIMEALGAVAAGLEGGFAGYYDQLQEMLLAFVAKQEATAKASKLRGKAFECISLLGFSVGKERFAPAAQRAMSAMMATTATDDVQTECIREAMERMCKVLGADFAPFLPALLPGILANMSLDSAVTVADGEDANEEEDEILLPTDEGFVKIKTGQVMEMLSIVGLLDVFIKETGVAYFDFVPATAEALSKILGMSDAILTVASSVRDSVYPCWANLVGAVSKAAPTRGQQAQEMVVALVQRFVDRVGADLIKADDPDDIAPMANGLADVVRNAGPGCLQPAQVQNVSDLALSEIVKSFQRDNALKAANKQTQPGQQHLGYGKQLDDDDDEDDGEKEPDVEEMEEQEARIGLMAILGACVKANTEVFLAHSLPKLQPLVQQWLAPQANPGRLLALHLSNDLFEHMGEQAVALWPMFIEPVLLSLNSDQADERQAAAFSVLLAAQVPAFGPQYAGRAYEALGASSQKFKPKKSDEDSQRAMDNVIAALVQLCLNHPALCPNLDICWTTIFSKMPLKVDTEEGHKVHRKIFVEAQKPGGGNLGSMARVAQVLGYLAEVYGKSEHCEDDLDRDLRLAFAGLPQGTLESLLSSFSPKQTKKVERILQEARTQA